MRWPGQKREHVRVHGDDGDSTRDSRERGPAPRGTVLCFVTPCKRCPACWRGTSGHAGTSQKAARHHTQARRAECSHRALAMAKLVLALLVWPWNGQVTVPAPPVRDDSGVHTFAAQLPQFAHIHDTF